MKQRFPQKNDWPTMAVQEWLLDRQVFDNEQSAHHFEKNNGQGHVANDKF